MITVTPQERDKNKLSLVSVKLKSCYSKLNKKRAFLYITDWIYYITLNVKRKQFNENHIVCGFLST